ncbi:hypothetical protein CSUB01_03745 [Colletotrichum sublineola]|uniref:Uncharacterized protein n=1 Tax=Colletotrichum sublineola TaxID=1173701 RepID=A0A066XYR8_COLSU|nr:hypothetical protein CSUB01_03745 [Colletotrichum sublineola]
MSSREQQRLIATVAPRSFLFFIVANVDPPQSGGGGGGGSEALFYRPIAITYRQGRAHGPGRTGKSDWQRVRQVVQDCARVVDALTSPGNQAIVEAELALARAEHRRSIHAEPGAPRVQVPDRPQPSLCDAIIFHGNVPEPDQVRGRRPASPPPVGQTPTVVHYPFISTCVRLALTRLDDETGARFEDVREQPLSTVYREDALEYGAVVIDISDLGAVKYGIVGSKLSYVAAREADLGGTFGWDPVESDYHGPPPKLHLEISGSRSPLSAAAYMIKFGFQHRMNGMDMPNASGRLHPRALEHIWPPVAGGNTVPRVPESPAHDKSEASAPDKAIRRLASLADSGDLDLIAHHDTMSSPDFQSRLREHPLGCSEHLWASGASLQLLRLAYAGQSRLNWPAYRHLSYEHVAEALDSNQLCSAQALSICIDEMDDEPTPNLFVTAAFSAPLRRAAWLHHLDTSARLNAPALRSAFPVQYMFVRQQFLPVEDVEKVDPETTVWPGWKTGSREEGEEKVDEPPAGDATYRPCHYFLGDALLSPGRFVSGFLQFCQSVLEDRYLASFASTPSTAASLSSAWETGPIGPLPGEVLAVPEHMDIPSPQQTQENSNPMPSVECWPLFGPLEPGSWVLLVSHEWRTTSRTRQLRRDYLGFGLPADSSIGVPVIRYALPRARWRITLTDRATSPGNGTPTFEQLASPDYVDMVCGVKEFLQETMPAADHASFESQLESTLQCLRTRWRVGSWPHGAFPADMHLLTTLDDVSARDMLSDFLADAGHLRDAIEDAQGSSQSHGSPWYPELQSLAPRGGPRRPRDRKVFRSFSEKETRRGAKPLGATRPVVPPEIVPGPMYPEPGEESSTWIDGPPEVIK